MNSTIQPMLAEPSTIGLGLLFLAIVAGAFLGIVVLIALIRLPKKPGPGNASGSNQESPERNRRPRAKSFWIGLPFAFLLAGIVLAAQSLASKPDALSPTEFLKIVDSHRIIQAKLYYDTHSPVYMFGSTISKFGLFVSPWRPCVPGVPPHPISGKCR